MFGVFRHHVEYKRSILFRGFDDVFFVPHSRHTAVDRADIEACSALRILASSEEAGVYAVIAGHGRQIFIMGHSEYDADTLKLEYLRDKSAGLPIEVPKTISQTMTTQKNRRSPGVPQPTCSIPIG